MGDIRAMQELGTSERAQGAVGAYASVIQRLDALAARRATVRYAVVDRCVAALEIDIDSRIQALSAALLAELGALLSTARVPAPRSASDGAETIDQVAGLAAVAEGVRHQHESWDGSGGPRSLAGKDIPLASRLVAIGSAIADVVTDAEEPTDWEEGLQRVRELRGSHLDPAIVDAYLGSIEDPEADHHAVDLAGCLSLLSAIRPSRGYPIEALSNISAAIGAIEDLEDVLALIAEQARRTVGASLVTIGRHDPSRGTISVLVNMGDLEPGQRQFPTDESYRFELPGDAEAKLVQTLGDNDEDLGSMVVAPIRSNDRPWGALIARAASGQAQLDADAVPVLEKVANEIGRAITKVERLSAVVEMAQRDPLTGVYNRRVLDARLRDIFDRPVPDRVDAALIMCDLDGLKDINDNLGHAVGDRVLVQLASALIEATDGYDRTDVCRLGGDEFCVLIERGGLLSADPIRERIEQLVARFTDPPVSVSCGVATASPDIVSPSELLRAADVAQYEVKRGRQLGRDAGAAHHGRRSIRDV